MNQVMLNLRPELQKRVEALAKMRAQAVPDLLVAILETALPPQLPFHAEKEREKVAFRAMHAELLKMYSDHYVAIFDGQLIDNDSDKDALFARIEETHPDKFVLVRQVTAEVEKIYQIRSPRLLLNDYE